MVRADFSFVLALLAQAVEQYRLARLFPLLASLPGLVPRNSAPQRSHVLAFRWTMGTPLVLALFPAATQAIEQNRRGRDGGEGGKPVPQIKQAVTGAGDGASAGAGGVRREEARLWHSREQ
ncbi:hypothetical protein [Geminicoccus flavidas]|uniref:hypothetical protein n=1 Tax=Geminicoccus flavidas TaxID=2506407 RepID=UPI0013578144|nr:hypothetical protein [Geminicoccus flavidas]